MRFSALAATIALLSLLACNGLGASTPEIGPGHTPVEATKAAEPARSTAPATQRSSDNILVETPAYAGVIVSQNGTSAFSYLFDQGSTEFWEPSINDVSTAEACIAMHLVSLQDNPRLDAYQREEAAFILQNLKEYRRQYVGIVVNGEKRIWCNAFFSDDSFPDWQLAPVDVDGGGRHYWQIEYDLLRDECLNFYVHGES